MFKEIVQRQGHDPKGNVDAYLVVWAMKELGNYDRAVLVSGDGDYYPLVDYLAGQGKLFAVLAPNRKYCSSLLRRSTKETFCGTSKTCVTWSSARREDAGATKMGATRRSEPGCLTPY